MTLQIRIQALVGLLVLGGGGVATLLVTNLLHERLHAAEERWMTALTKAVGEGIARDLIDGNAHHAHETLSTIVRNNPRLDYAYILDFESQVFSHTFDGGFPAALAETGSERTPGATTQATPSAQAHIRKISHPLLEGLDASIHLGINQARTNTLVGETQTQILFVFAALAVAGLVLTIPFVRRITRPLERLADDVRAYGEGRLQGPLRPEKADTEITRLAESFNRMVRDYRQAEQALRHSEEGYRALVETTSDWVWAVDQNAVYTYASPKVAELLGYAPEEIVGKTPFDLMSESEAKRIAEAFGKTAAAREPFSALENVNRHKDGRAVILETSGVPIFGEDGEFLGYRGIDRDITARKRVETALHESRSMLQLVLDSIPVRLFWKDCESVYLGCNRLFAEDAGLASPEEVIGQNDFELGWRDQADLYQADDRRVMESRTPKLNYEEPQTAPDGTVLCLRTSKIPLTTLDGQVIGILGCYEDITKAKDAETALLESEASLADAQRIAHMGNWVLDIPKNELRHSEEVYRIFEIDPQPSYISYDVLMEKVHPDDRDYVTRAYRDSVKNRTPCSIVHRLAMPDDRVKYVNERCETFYDEDGNAIRSLGTVQDITERKQIEDELRRHKEHLEELVQQRTAVILDQAQVIDQVQGAVVSTDLGGRVTSWNRGAERLFGYLLEETMGRNMEFLAAEAEGPILGERVLDPLRAKGEHDTEVRMRKKNGEEFFGHLSLSMRYDSMGTPAGIIGYALDATQRRQAEHALRESEERYRAVVEDQTELVCRFRPDGLLTFVNDAYCRYFGEEREALIGNSFMPLIPEEDRTLVTGSVESLSLEHPVSTVEHRVIMPDGTIRWHQWTNRAIFNANGVLLEYQGVGRDVTLRKQAEAELHRQSAELAEINRELESFSYSVSHDLRSPLRSIDGFSQALLDDCGRRLTDGCVDHLKRVRRASQRMGDLIDDLLMLSRVTRREMRYETVDLSALARDIAGGLQESQPKRKVEIAIQDGLYVRGDGPLLQIALENLLDNAWKYTAKKKVGNIAFGIAEGGPDGAFYVRDNGVGFDMRYADKLFGAFQRLHAANQFEGTGIGLATVQRVIGRHGGRVWVDAKAGRGATFYFTLPAHEAFVGTS